MGKNSEPKKPGKEKPPDTKEPEKGNKTEEEIPYPGWEPLKAIHYIYRRKPAPGDEPIEHFYRITGKE